MGHIALRAITLVQLPPELLYQMLALLDAYNLVRLRQTCKALKALIDNSEVLQYVIDLSYFQMIPMGTSEMDELPATCRKRLRQHDAAWQRFEYKQKCTLPSVMLGRMFEFLGGVYGSAGEDCIHFTRLPSAADSNDLHCWSHPIDATTLVDFTFCAAQDLLVVVADSPNPRTYPYDIHLRSLTTNDIHHDAAQPILKALDRDIIDREIVRSTGHVNVQIMGDYISMQMRNIVVNGAMLGNYIQMWDWKTNDGYQFILWFHSGFNDCSFIAEDKFLVLDSCGTVEIYHIANKSKPPQCTAKLSLPSLTNHFSYTEAFTGEYIFPSSLLPYSRESYQPSCSFHPSTDDQLIAIHVSAFPMDTSTIDLRRYSFFILRSAILELESLFACTYGQPTLNGPTLLWSTWGPRHTTWFRRQSNEDWESSLYGFRVIEPIRNSPSDLSREPRRLRIRDFNPHIAGNYHAQDKSDWRGQLVQGELTSTISYPFGEPLGSALSYREIVSEELFDLDEALMDESRILMNCGREANFMNCKKSTYWYFDYLMLTPWEVWSLRVACPSVEGNCFIVCSFLYIPCFSA
ncbi:hypothetical protein DEU56DRAFT_803852 [Suillus clintonianus]|uniref:uncharacterized protein n=1 Tax=Suillus clintonianus TaxID=1904413 RepID=UPI001B88521F|nr:uncharacterized protein DEU56DRAFT_803852 [Suillus clintonianus]KAG2137484.1 hypothetical protein DEU56DRAFT_803852 [Suillus clintonianus]